MSDPEYMQLQATRAARAMKRRIRLAEWLEEELDGEWWVDVYEWKDEK